VALAVVYHHYCLLVILDLKQDDGEAMVMVYYCESPKSCTIWPVRLVTRYWHWKSLKRGDLAVQK
jgi:hypothetical protein